MYRLKNLSAQKVIIAAHRGTFGANIIQNTIPAFLTAIKQGADMIEVDVISSKDGVLYGFHTCAEASLGMSVNISELTSLEIDKHNCHNVLEQKSGFTLNRLTDILEQLRGKCFINIDRAFVDNWEGVINIIEEANAQQYVLLKSPPQEQFLVSLQNKKIMYMPILRSLKEFELVKKFDINIVAVELIFDTLEHELVLPETMKSFENAGLLTWVNAIDMGEEHNLSAGLTDTKAILESEEDNWGKLIELGFNIIQTDWPSILDSYLKTI
ncbi:MAG: hypothetical protein ATN36_07340 [Epulopiscium sp. Nele67-Bin005]|nr:MAG: hypothetical protein ATN36_07340 [Epulopiscium sp. Nele67-Bin005]